MNPQERLAEWKTFRQSLNKENPEQALNNICTWWSYVPFVDKYLATIAVSKWPGPWELIYEGKICDIGRALGMLYTWSLTDHAKNFNTELRQYYNHCREEMVNCVYINPGDFVLNLEFNTVLKKHSFNSGFELIHTYPANKLLEI
jgi:hypothetical protein